MALTQVRGSGISNMVISDAGIITKPLQPAFLVHPASQQSNISINTDVTVVFGTEVFDQNSDFASNTFTAPVTGKYQFNVFFRLAQIDTAADYIEIKLVTSNRTLQLAIFDPDGLDSDAAYWQVSAGVLTDMDASDTASIQIRQVAGTAQLDIQVETSFSGYLVA